jgi:prepilin-type N-terminal cleavage/methylation domain-containing protein
VSEVGGRLARKCSENSASGAIQRCERHRPEGFTLMELLVSMTIMGFLALAIHFGFRVGINAWAKGGDSLERVRRVQAVFDVLSRQIGSMVPYYSQQRLDRAPVEVLLFQGTETGMRFVSTFSSHSRTAGGLRLVEYFVTGSKDRKGKTLLINERPLPDDAALAQSVITEIGRKQDNTVVVQFAGFIRREDSIAMVEGFEDGKFQYSKRQPPKEGTSPARLSLTGQRRDLLPPGVEIKLRWREPEFFYAKDFTVVIPVQAAGL